jgi:hypothetical protein
MHRKQQDSYPGLPVIPDKKGIIWTNEATWNMEATTRQKVNEVGVKSSKGRKQPTLPFRFQDQVK